VWVYILAATITTTKKLKQKRLNWLLVSNSVNSKQNMVLQVQVKLQKLPTKHKILNETKKEKKRQDKVSNCIIQKKVMLCCDVMWVVK